MSQGEAVPRPSSPSSTERATNVSSTSPTSCRTRMYVDDPGTRQPYHDPRGRAAVTEVDAKRQQLRGPKSSDTHDTIGNFDGPQRGMATSGPPPASISLACALPGEPTASSSIMARSPYGAAEGSPSRRFVYQPSSITATSQSNPSTTAATSPPGPQRMSVDHPPQQSSPPASHPYAISARQILTPKSPRASLLGRSALRPLEPPAIPASNLASSAVSRGSVTAPEYHAQSGYIAAPSAAPTQYAPPPSQGHQSIAPAPAPVRASADPVRPSTSYGYYQSGTYTEPLRTAGVKREHSGQPIYTNSPYTTTPSSLSVNRTYSAPAAFGETKHWDPTGILNPATVAKSDALKKLAIEGGQPVLALKPQDGEEILVPVDLHGGSKIQDEKRQRNAGASARFRQRKKEREKDLAEMNTRMAEHIRELESRYNELLKHCNDLAADREFYRNERNRLRELVLRTPSIKEWAERAPPSPPQRPAPPPYTLDSSAFYPPTTSSPPSPNSPPPSSQTQPAVYPQPTHPRSVSYPDTSVREPPARRRRTDSEPTLPSTSYASMAPTSALPPYLSATSTTCPTTQALHHSMPPPPPQPQAHQTPYTMSPGPSPHITPPPGPPRLPPLRFEHSQAQPPAQQPGPAPAPVPSGPRTPSATPPPVASALPAPQPHPYPQAQAHGQQSQSQPSGGYQEPYQQSSSSYQSGQGATRTSSPFRAGYTTAKAPYETGWATEPPPVRHAPPPMPPSTGSESNGR